MTIDFGGVLRALGVQSFWLAVVLVLIVWVLFFPDRVDRVRVGVLGMFSFLGSGVRRRFHREAVKSALNPAIRDLAGLLGLPHELPKADIRYARSVEEVRPQFQNGRVIIFVRDGQGRRAENITRAALAYTNAAVYPRSRPYLNETTNKALDMALTRRLISNDRDAFFFFTRHFVQDMCKVNAQLNAIYNSILDLDERGMLPSILLHQLQLLTTRLYPAHQFEPAVQQEVVGFINFLSRVANRKTGEKVRLEYELEYIRVGVIMLAADETLESRGLEPHLKVASRYAVGRYHGIYLLAGGRKSGLVRQFVNKLERNAYFAERIAAVSVHDHVATQNRAQGGDIAVGYVQLRS